MQTEHVDQGSEPFGRVHLAQFYGANERLLVANVADFFAEGLAAGNGALIVADPKRNAAVLEELARVMPDRAFGANVVTLDASGALGSFMLAGRPDRALFDRTIGDRARALSAAGHFRAYGEMVGLLWLTGQRLAAITLEDFWNDLQSSIHFDLFCGYPIDVLRPEFQIGSVRELVLSHTSLISAIPDGFEGAIERAMHDVLGPKATGLRLVGRSIPEVSATLPYAERTALWLRNKLPRYADEILAKARQYCAD
jgi:hypothetical protein